MQADINGLLADVALKSKSDRDLALTMADIESRIGDYRRSILAEDRWLDDSAGVAAHQAGEVRAADAMREMFLRLGSDLLESNAAANERVAGDTRANAASNVYITVDPAPARTDLREIRATIKQALIRHREVPDEERAMLSLVPLLPKRLVRVTGSATSVVSSHLGVINPAASRPDGTDADYFAVKLLYPGVTKAVMYRLGGLLVLDSGRAHEQVFVSVIAYQPGRPNSSDGLRQDLSSAVNDFSLAGTYL